MPRPSLLPLPDLDTMRRHASETAAVGSLAMERAQAQEVREAVTGLVTGLFIRFGSHLAASDEQDYLMKALSSAARLGWAFALVENSLGLVQTARVDARIWNGIVGSAHAFSGLPGELQMMMFYSVQAGYYVGRTGDLGTLLDASAEQ